MKLYLSSYRIPDIDSFKKFVGKDDIHIGLILNAKDYKTHDERAAKRGELISYFSGFGFTVEEINLLNYVDRREELLNTFKSYDVVWLNGGNTFCLRWAIAECEGEDILRQALEEGVVYGGDSAGAIVAGPTLKYFNSADDPTLAREAIYEGLNLIDFVILPHWGSEEYGEILMATQKSLKQDGYITKEIDDSEYLCIEQ